MRLPGGTGGADRQSGGLKPACITTCPTGALNFGERDDLIAQAKGRIAASPGRYVNHMYGEKEVGGTSWLYLSPVPFDKIGLKDHQSEPVTVNVQRAMGFVPPVLLVVAVAMSGIYWLTKRRQKIEQAPPAEEAGKGAAQK